MNLAKASHRGLIVGAQLHVVLSVSTCWTCSKRFYHCPGPEMQNGMQSTLKFIVIGVIVGDVHRFSG